MTFAFTCTGGGTVALTFATAGKDVSTAAGAQECDGSIYQRSIGTPEPGLIGFSYSLTGSENGGYAYGYYAEKKQLP